MRTQYTTGSLLLSLGLVMLACQPLGQSSAGTEARGSTDEDLGAWKSGAVTPPSNQSGGSSESGGSSDEICDGWDNDLDGQIDEGTDGEACRLSNGGEGHRVCASGELRCMQCRPGEMKSESCGCGTDRIDVCSPEGRWVEGPCDTCEQPVEPCECNPGEQMVRRCDDCSGEDCGATCVGATFECTEQCTWQQTSACEAKVPQCMGDTSRTEQCGYCGSRELECDGCFWTYERCEEQGACMPGETKTTQCFDGVCAEGLTSEISCNDQCEWSEPSVCQGCIPGTVEDTPVPCLEGYACGNVIQRQTCVATLLPICGNESLVQGVWVESTVGTCALECVPGETAPCSMPDGRAGEFEIGCDNTCHLTGPPGACGAGSSSCVPGTVQTSTQDCGCGATKTVTRTCRASGDGWSTQTDASQCPQCKPGDSKPVSCTTSSGMCGQASQVCGASCTYQAPQSCQPRADACQPGQSSSESFSCGPNTCGRQYTVTRRCRADGCGWETTEDRSQCPACQQGSTRDSGQLCVAGQPACGTKQQFCDASCNWQNQPCGSCD